MTGREHPLPYRKPIYDRIEDHIAWITEETARRRADLRPLSCGEVVEAMLLGAGPDDWTCVVRGPMKARLANGQLKDENGYLCGFPGGIVTAYVADLTEDGVIYLSRWPV